MLLIRLKFENKICYKRKLHLFFVLIFYVFFFASRLIAIPLPVEVVSTPVIFFLYFYFDLSIFYSWNTNHQMGDGWTLFVYQKPYKNIFIMKFEVIKQNSACNS